MKKIIFLSILSLSLVAWSLDEAVYENCIGNCELNYNSCLSMCDSSRQYGCESSCRSQYQGCTRMCRMSR